MTEQALKRTTDRLDEGVNRNMKAQASLKPCTIPQIWEEAARYYLEHVHGIVIPTQYKTVEKNSAKEPSLS